MSNFPVLCPDGLPPRLIVLAHECGMCLTMMDWGGTWISCGIPLPDGSLREILLGCGRLEDYFQQKAYLGATLGRYANRIGHSAFSRQGKNYSLLPNQGAHHLHGGPNGFSQRRWKIIERSTSHVCLGIESVDGDQGYPGNLSARVTYRLLPDCFISMEYEASVDAPCPVNLSNHAYFNLDGEATDVRQHTLQILADQYLPVGEGQIPSGELRPVAGSAFDFNAPKCIAQDFGVDEQLQSSNGYDHAFLLKSACRSLAVPAAVLVSADRSLQMDLYTTKPALQFYSGNRLAGTPGRGGKVYAAHQGLTLGAQFLPDSPNHPQWPQADCWLKPGETYRYLTQLYFHCVDD